MGWDGIAELDEEGMGELVREMVRFREGRKMGVQVECEVEEQDDVPESAAQDGKATPDSMSVSKISFLGHNSTVNAEELLAHTELLTSLIHLLAYTHTPSSLATWLESFRPSATQVVPHLLRNSSPSSYPPPQRSQRN